MTLEAGILCRMRSKDGVPKGFFSTLLHECITPLYFCYFNVSRHAGCCYSIRYLGQFLDWICIYTETDSYGINSNKF